MPDSPDAAEEVHCHGVEGVINPRAPQQLRCEDHDQPSNGTDDGCPIVLDHGTG